jgi:hypothetical protein
MIMHGLRTLLLAQSSITALAPAQTLHGATVPAVVCDNAPQGMSPPYVVLTDISSDPMNTLDAYSESLQSVEVDIDCYSYSEPAARTLGQTVWRFIRDYTGAAGSDDTVKAVVVQDSGTYRYDFPAEGRDTRFHIVTLSMLIQYSTP